MEKTRIELVRKPGKEPLTCHEKEDVLYFSFPGLDKEKGLLHGMSSRLGGVSENELFSMNLSFTRGDKPENVVENFERIAKAIGFCTEQMVFSHQTHSLCVREVSKEDCGKGFNRERDFQDVDGLITNVPGVILTTFYADCVPLFFYDPVKKAVGLSHSGWRGTVGDIAGETIRKMQQCYQSRPEDLLVAIGPSICQTCYQVGEEVIDQFQRAYEKELWPLLYYKEASCEGKYRLNLWEACRQNFLRAGVLRERIFTTDLCTCCNPQLFFSHRASGGKRGNLAAFAGILS